MHWQQLFSVAMALAAAGGRALGRVCFGLPGSPIACLLAIAGIIGPATVPARAAGSGISFNRDIRPLLTEHCIRCHGPDTAEAGLDLSARTSATGALASGERALVPGDAAASVVIARITSTDPDVRMPPGDERPLSAAEADLIASWIAAGAEYEDHWAFRPLARPPVPAAPAAAGDAAATAHPIDAFVRDRLAREGLTPSPPADPHTLLKRVHLDLTGLLPTPEEVAAFVADPSDAAYEAIVERLLASPHFGERWGRHWLDLARYADSDGYEKDSPRPDAWVYRDWVINAFNANLPFDVFTIRQLAGDLVPDATSDTLIATAFNRQTLTNTEGGVDQEEFRVAACMDRTDTVGSVWLGLTVGCAKCHTHKYDPITHAEYFSLYAFFNEADETVQRLPVVATEAAAVEARLAPLRRDLAARERAIAPAQRAWEERERAFLESTPNPPLEVRPARVTAVASAAGLAYTALDDGSWRVAAATALGACAAPGDTAPADGSTESGAPGTAAQPDSIQPPPDVDTLVVTLADLPAESTGLRLETLPDAALPAGGAGLAADGTFVITRLAADVVDAAGTVLRSLPLQRPTADTEAKGFAAADVLGTGDQQKGWGGALAVAGPHHLQVRSRERLTLTAGESLRLTVETRHGGGHLLGRLRVRAVVGDWTELHLPPAVVKALRQYPEKRVYETRQTLFDHFAADDAEVGRLQAAIDAVLRESQARVMPVRLLATARLDRPTHRFDRGDFLSPAEVVGPGVPAVLPRLVPASPSGRRPTRLDLARWLVGPANPLTPRVIANQWWARLFGQGLVRSVGDFGTRGEPPSHPELLDWLAATYRDHLAWDTKAFLRTILLSATYRQASAHRPELADVDPLNVLLARQNRLRVEAEIVRDLALEVAGLLVPTVGGPSVFPPMPPDLAALSYANNFTWKESTGPDRHRRGMYTFFKRTIPHPTLMTFDCPDANLTCVLRSVSNTPLQALTVLNETAFVEAAQALARRILATADDDSGGQRTAAADRGRLARAIGLCLCRPARDAEVAQLTDLLTAARAHYASDPAAAAALASAASPPAAASDDAPAASGDAPASPAAPTPAAPAITAATTAEIAAWVATVRVLLNLDEFITRE